MQQDTSPALDELLAHPAVNVAGAHIVATDDRTLAQQIELTEIPAPPFGEAARGKRMAVLLQEAGLEDVRSDEVGNIVALRPGDQAGPPVVIAAHLDTVFPSGTDLTVRKDGNVLRGPGIADDGRGLSALLALARSLTEADLTTDLPILFAATVGEEGNGDLRGVKHLFRDGGEVRSATGFISLDGAGIRTVVTRGLGARRFRVVVRGPGGHSWTDQGTPNPIHALGRAIGALAIWPTPSSPTLTLTVSRWGGGTSVNSIPAEAWAELDLRSESLGHLDTAEERVRSVLQRSLKEENSEARETSDDLDLDMILIGERPPGVTPSDSPLVEAALASTRMFDVEPDLVASSTDANFPMSLGIPAITLGAGGMAGDAHTLKEWYRNEGGTEGLQRALYTTLLTAGVV